MIAMLQKLLGEHDINEGCYRAARLHHLSGDEPVSHLSVSSKLNAEWAFLCHLHDLGGATTETWLADHFEVLSAHSTLDMERIFQEIELSLS